MTQFSATVDPVVEPVTLAEAKKHLRIDPDIQDEDALIEDCIISARLVLEDTYKIRILTQTVELRLDYFGEQQDHYQGYYSYYKGGLRAWPWTSAIEVQPPLQSVTSIKYYDPQNTLQTLSSSVYATARENSNPALIYCKPGQVWPVTAFRPDAVVVTYVAGWTSQNLVPLDIKRAVKQLVGHFFNNREEIVLGTVRTKAVQMPWSVEALMGNYGRDLVH